MLFCIRLPNFIQTRRHIDFSRWRTRPLNTTSGFVFVDVNAFSKSKSVTKPNFWRKKQASVIFEFYFRFWFRLCHRNVHAILHHAVKFHPIGPPAAETWRHIGFSTWRPRSFNATSGFLIVDATVFGRLKIYQQTKFRRDITIHGCDITTSVFEK